MKPPRSLKITDNEIGTGRPCVPGDLAICHCVCTRRKGDVLFASDAALFLVILTLGTAAWSIPLAAAFERPLLPPVLTALAAGYAGLLHYEWVHLVSHTTYRPTNRVHAHLARNHRLHHYRNERYWLGVTSNLGDRVLGTLPKAKSDVPRSDTARHLDG